MLFALGIILLIITPISAKEVDLTWAQPLKELADEVSKNPPKKAVDLVQRAKEAASQPKVCRAAQKIVSNAHQNLDVTKQSKEEKRHPDLLICVSFSMPDETIKALAAQAQKEGGKVVFRGLYKGSFREMGQKLRKLGIEALIDPVVFQKNAVQQVPTFLYKGDRVSGNISLPYALKTLQGEKT